MDADHTAQSSANPLNVSDSAHGPSDVHQDATPIQPYSEDQEMDDFTDFPGLQQVSDSSDDEATEDLMAEVRRQIAESFASTSQPPLHPTPLAAPRPEPVSRTSSNRRARVEDDEDEERDRRHPSQRVTDPLNSGSQSQRPSSTSTPQPPQTQPPRPHFHHILQATVNLPRAGLAENTPLPPFRFFHHARPATAPAAGNNPGPQPAPPGGADGQPPLPPFMDGLTLTFDILGGPMPPRHDQHQTDGEDALPSGATPPPNPAENPEPGARRRGVPFQPGFGFLNDILLGGGMGLELDKEDPERAKKLVGGLDEVPVGLVRRLVQVGGTGGGMGQDEAHGGDAGCAICWDSLLIEETADAEVSQPKIVSLPCAHVFHADCLIPWFSRPHQTTCPTCRFNIDPENLTYVSWRQRNREQQEREGAAAPPAEQTTGDAPQSPPAGPADDAQPPPANRPPIPLDWAIRPIIIPIPVPASTPPRAASQASANGEPAVNQPSQPTTTTPAPGDYTRFLSRFGRAPSNQATVQNLFPPPFFALGRQQGEERPTQPPAPAIPPQAGPQLAANADAEPGPQFTPRAVSTFDIAPGVHADIVHFDMVFELPRRRTQAVQAGQPQAEAQSPPAQPQAQTQQQPTPPPPRAGQTQSPETAIGAWIANAVIEATTRRMNRHAAAAQNPTANPGPPRNPMAEMMNDMRTSLYGPGAGQPPLDPGEEPPAGPFPFAPPQNAPAPDMARSLFELFMNAMAGGRPEEEGEKKPWALPPAPGPTLRQRIERREREAGMRCCDVSCGIGPSDEDPEMSDVAKNMGMLSLVNQQGEHVCEHCFHSACLVSAERVALRGAEVVEENDKVAVTCPVCRGIGSIGKQQWDEGVRALM